MEAYQEKDVKRDSFEEVDRILAIVEESKKKFDKEQFTYNSILTISFIAATVFGGIMLFHYLKGDLDRDIIMPIAFISSIIEIVYTLNVKEKARHEFEQTRDQATEVIREVVPALSRSERWSALRKFELRLRLSKLGISADTIFGREFDLP